MTDTIWKVRLNPEAVQRIEVPGGAEFLCVREQSDEICVWFRVDPAAPSIPIDIAIAGTGNEILEGFQRYLGTAFLWGGRMVCHVFQRDGQS